MYPSWNNYVIIPHHISSYYYLCMCPWQCTCCQSLTACFTITHNHNNTNDAKNRRSISPWYIGYMKYRAVNFSVLLKMNGRSKKVKVWVRTRPTSNFAHDMIDLEPDSKVRQIVCKKKNEMLMDVILFTPGHRSLSDFWKNFRVILNWNVWEIVIIVLVKVVKLRNCLEFIYDQQEQCSNLISAMVKISGLKFKY